MSWDETYVTHINFHLRVEVEDMDDFQEDIKRIYFKLNFLKNQAL